MSLQANNFNEKDHLLGSSTVNITHATTLYRTVHGQHKLTKSTPVVFKLRAG